MLDQCWFIVCDAGPALARNWRTLSCLHSLILDMRKLLLLWVLSCANKHQTLRQCWFNAGPLSATIAKHQTSIGWRCSVLSWALSSERARWVLWEFRKRKSSVPPVVGWWHYWGWLQWCRVHATGWSDPGVAGTGVCWEPGGGARTRPPISHLINQGKWLRCAVTSLDGSIMMLQSYIRWAGALG